MVGCSAKVLQRYNAYCKLYIGEGALFRHMCRDLKRKHVLHSLRFDISIHINDYTDSEYTEIRK